MSTRAAETRYHKDFLKSLDMVGQWLRSRKIPRSCLQNQSESDDQGLITLTGFDCASFASLCEIFVPIFDSYTPFIPSGKSCFKRKKQKNKGMKQKIHPEDCLGLVLAWTLAGKVADMSAICRPDSQKSVLLADSAKSCRHKFFPDTFFCVGDCRLSPNFL